MLQPTDFIQSHWLHTNEERKEVMEYLCGENEIRKKHGSRQHKEKQLLLKMNEIMTQLAEFEAILVISVLETTVEMLNVLSHTNDKPTVRAETIYKSLEERFGKLHQEQPVIDREINAPLDLETEDAKFRKIQKELVSFEATLITTIKDLITHGNYKSLENFVIYRILEKIEEEELLFSEKRNERAVVNLKAENSRLSERFSARKEELEQKLANTKDEIYGVLLTHAIEAQFSTKWENAKTDQLIYQYKRMEDTIKKKIMDVGIEIDDEILINRNIVNFYNYEIKRLNDECEAQRQKLKTDSEEINLKIKHLNCNLEDLRKTKQETKSLYEHRQNLLIEREQEKEQQRLEEEMQILCNAMAKRIQAWWRAILLRRRIRALKRKGKLKGK